MVVVPSGPQGGNGDGGDSVSEADDTRAGVDDQAGGECRAESFGAPLEVPGVGPGRSCGRLDLDRDDLAVTGLDEQVDLVPAIGVAEVEQVGSDGTPTA